MFGITDALPVLVATVGAGRPRRVQRDVDRVHLGLLSDTGALSVWVTRLTQFVVGGAFAIGMMILLWPARACGK